MTLRELGRELTFPDGAGGLETTRLEVVLDAGELPDSGSPLELTYADMNDLERIGWREIVLVATGGAAVASASVPDESVSDELRAYPEDLLQSPLDVRQATARVTPGTLAGPPPALSGGGELASPVRVSESTENGFTELISRESLSIGVVVVSLLVAMFWGAVHALSPGHGKAIVAAYLIGTRGTSRHALYLGLIVTVTHTIGVFALGAITLGLSELIVPDDLYPWMNLASAILVVGVGVTVLRMRILDWVRGGARRLSGGQPHDHSHDHDTTTTTTTTTGTSTTMGTSTARNTATRTDTATITTSPRRGPAGAAFSASASRVGCSRARARSSCCSPQSRSTASATGSS